MRPFSLPVPGVTAGWRRRRRPGRGRFLVAAALLVLLLLVDARSVGTLADLAVGSGGTILGALAIGLVMAFAAEVNRRRTVEAELTAVRRDLELHVRERTRELERMNTVLRSRQAKLARLAMQDGLTGLPNRRMLFDILHREQERTRRFGGRFALLLADLDGFKSVNDRFGHAVGDRLLVQVAGRLTDAVRASDVVARLGGDEFAILMREPGDDGALAALAARIAAATAAPCRIGDRQVGIGLSLGAALFPAECADLDGLLDLADRRLYADKRRPAEQPPAAPPLRLVWPPDPDRGRPVEATSCGTGRA